MATRKAPTGAKHDRCIGHVEHPYPAKGMLCYGAVIGEAGMVEFADHLATVAAERKAARAIVPARPESWTTGTGKSRRLRPIGKDEKGRNIVPGTVCIGNGDDGGCHSHSVHAHATYPHLSRSAADAAKLAELVARFRAMRGLPADAPVVVAPVRKARNVTPAAERAAARAAILAANPVDRSRCYQYQHTSGVEPIRCVVTPDLHDGPHDFPAPVLEPIADTYAAAVELAETRPDPCEACGHPAHGATCATCDDAAQVGTYAPCSVAPIVTAEPVIVAEPAPVLSAPATASRPTCERCGQVFRVKGAGAEWHRVNRPDCARVAAAV